MPSNKLVKSKAVVRKILWISGFLKSMTSENRKYKGGSVAPFVTLGFAGCD